MPLMNEAMREQRRAAGRKGGLARARQFTRDSQKAARRKVSSEALARNGAKGAAVTIARHGMGKLRERSRQYRLKHPSKLELLVIGILARLKLEYEREFIVCDERGFTVDFYLPNEALAIEVHGAIHDEGKPGYEKRVQNDQAKRSLLRTQKRRLLVLHHSEFANVASVIATIKRRLKKW